MKKLIFIATLLFALSFTAFAQSAIVISENANLRGTANQNGKVVSVLSNGTNIEVIKQRGTWFLVQSPEYVGWLHGNTLRLTSPLTVETIDAGELPTSPLPPRRTTPATTTPRATTESRGYIRGPRGGCYYINRNGRKTYVDRSLCN